MKANFIKNTPISQDDICITTREMLTSRCINGIISDNDRKILQNLYFYEAMRFSSDFTVKSNLRFITDTYLGAAFLYARFDTPSLTLSGTMGHYIANTRLYEILISVLIKHALICKVPLDFRFCASKIKITSRDFPFDNLFFGDILSVFNGIIVRNCKSGIKTIVLPLQSTGYNADYTKTETDHICDPFSVFNIY